MGNIFDDILKIKKEDRELQFYLNYDSLESNLKNQKALKRNKYIAIEIIDGVSSNNIQFQMFAVDRMNDCLEKVKLNFDKNLEDHRTKRLIIDYAFGNTQEELFRKMLPDDIIDKMNNGDIPVNFKEKNQGFF